ncbi:DUF2497 domain-containing protein [Novosphingobium flavum]|uniref:DUF2497 domain-containing protein n=1 Tax=Novosphingobium aerophilum TaxID=2839843 RepID=A0A7X1F919_9SPHN|nr:DUF2497 domain-containing protein [Novosphingobium aerophilum]MBC2652606.1 DUF2497 domain-containing protein [Novosphingobium aerophilum]MBC2662413.1 DUF2497 domain-containing protein [Novosphingobium aerophilum]
MRQAGEPTVEEILDSIKKVIARDSRLPASEDRRPAAASAPAASRTPRAPVIADEVLDLAEAEAFDLDDDDADAPLLPDQAVHAMRDSLAALATMAAPGAAPQIVRSGETSLEGLVRDMLRPMLAEWLDKNLPPMVERLVAAEIARIVGKKG